MKKVRFPLICRSYHSRRCLEKQGVVVLTYTKTKYRGKEGEEAGIYDDPIIFKTEDGKYISLNWASPRQTHLLTPHSVSHSAQYSALERYYLWVRVSTLGKSIFYSCSRFSKQLSEALFLVWVGWLFFFFFLKYLFCPQSFHLILLPILNELYLYSHQSVSVALHKL